MWMLSLILSLLYEIIGLQVLDKFQGIKYKQFDESCDRMLSGMSYLIVNEKEEHLLWSMNLGQNPHKK